MNINDCIIRLERKEEYREVENLVRESFWNVYRPGCSEHYVIHVLRDDPDFVKELDFVMEQNGKLIGQNMFMRTVIDGDDGREIPVLTMGPIGIIPELKRKGYGKKLLDYSLEKATEMGFGAVLFEGKLLAFVPKSYMPNYSEFYERRQFTPFQQNMKTKRVSFAGFTNIPFGTDIIISEKEINECATMEDVIMIGYPNGLEEIGKADAMNARLEVLTDT